MPANRHESDALLADLTARLARLVEVARQEGRNEALANIQSVLAGGMPVAGAAPVRRGPGRPRKVPVAAEAPSADAPVKRRRNPWAGLSPEAHLARVNAIRRGKGLPLKES